MYWDREFAYIMLFVGFWLFLLIGAILLPKEQKRIMALSLPALVVFVALFLVVSVLLVLVIILLPTDKENYILGLVFMMILVAASASYLFTKKYIFKENLEEANRLLEEARAGDDSLDDDSDTDTVDEPMRQRIRNLGLSALPLMTLFCGALLTRYFGHLLYLWPITVGSAIALITAMARLGWLGAKEETDSWGSARIFTLIIPISMSYFMFVVMVCAADVKLIKSLI